MTNSDHFECCAVLCCAVLCCAVLCCAVLCCAVLCWSWLGAVPRSLPQSNASRIGVVGLRTRGRRRRRAVCARGDLARARCSRRARGCITVWSGTHAYDREEACRSHLGEPCARGGVRFRSPFSSWSLRPWPLLRRVVGDRQSLQDPARQVSNGKAIPHPSGGAEVAWDEERQEAADAQSNASSDAPPDATATAVGCANRGTATNVRATRTAHYAARRRSRSPSTRSIRPTSSPARTTVASATTIAASITRWMVASTGVTASRRTISTRIRVPATPTTLRATRM